AGVLLDFEAPPITIQSNKLSRVNFNGSNIGSMESQRIAFGFFSLSLVNATSALATRACRSTVVPVQRLGGRLNSDIRFGNFVNTRKFHCRFSCTILSIASIHSRGIHRPNKSDIEQRKTFLKRVSNIASRGTAVLRGAFST